MARGHEDWGLNTGDYSGYVTDLSEVAARLGSPAVWIRTGKVVFIETFDTTWRSFIDLSSNNNKGAFIDTIQQYSGSGCLMLDGQGSNAVTAKVIKGLPFIQLGKQGLELLVSSKNDFQVLTMSLTYYKLNTEQSFVLLLDYPNHKLSYYNDSAVLVDIDDTLDITSTRDYYNYIKMVVDLDLVEWSHIWFNETKYDLVGVAANSGVSSADSPRIELSLSTLGTASGQDYIYIDHVIYTIDEP